MSHLEQDEPKGIKKRSTRKVLNGNEAHTGNINIPTKKLTARSNQENTIDFGDAKSKTEEINFGTVVTPASSPHLNALKLEYSWKKYAKQNQINILWMLMLAVVITIGAEMIDSHIIAHQTGQAPKTYMKDVLGYIIPIFTFMLGMGSQPRNEN